jgi:heat shock protein HslJ
VLSGYLYVAISILPGAAALAQNTTDATSPAPLRAQGNEPFWSLTLDSDTMTFQPMEGAAIQAALPQVEDLEGGAVRYAAANLSLTLMPEICRDTMTGMPHPLTAEIAADDQTFFGCAGAPMDLIAGPEWRVSMIGDAVVAPEGSVTLAVDGAAGRVSGTSGCNQYFGAMTLTGEGLILGPEFGASMMMCDDTIMTTERDFLGAIATVTRFDIAEDGALLLIAGDETVIRAER